jgi:hypothetical protein
MDFSTRGTAHWDTEPQPMMSNFPLNCMKHLHSIEIDEREIVYRAGSYPMTSFNSTR